MPSAFRAACWLTAGIFFVWQNAAMYLWLRQHQTVGSGLAHMWQSLSADWLLLLILTDACIFSALALAWFYADMRKRGFTVARQSGLLLAALAIGSPVMLIYLASRKS
jgi:hypothetical protein